MEKKEAISVRITRLQQILQSPYTQGGTVINSRLNIEGLQDALLALYDECNTDQMKKLPDVAKFVQNFNSTVSELRCLRVQPSDFEKQTLIGRGNFGKVNLVKEKATGHFYAMKTLPKQCTQGLKEASSYEEERDILALAARPGATQWLPTLQFAFQDVRHLYLVMEYLPGGDLLGLLDKFEGSLPEATAKFYLAEIVLAINSLHQLGYVHRDVKPDNVLLDVCGHIKLADFGSAAKLNASGKVNSPMPVGTPEYIAPEVLQSVSGKTAKYGVEVDYWSLGIVAYELIYGITPFNGAERTHVYSSIMAHEGGESLEFPSCSSISRDLRALISGLLEPPTSRFNFMHIKRHSFFSGTPWDTIRDSVPPYVPVVYGEADTSNFPEPADDDTDTISLENFRSKHSGFSGEQLPFVGFTLTPGTAPIKPKRQEEGFDKVPVASGSKSEHPDIVRNKEIQVMKEMLQDREKRLEKASAERREAELKLDHMTMKASSYRKVIEQERIERREVETKAVDVVKSLKAKWQAASQQKVSEITAQLEIATSGMHLQKSRVDELEEKLRTREEQLTAERNNSDRLHNLLQQQKSNMTKARRETLTFMGDAGQILELKNKLLAEESLKEKLQDKTVSLAGQLNELKEQLKDLLSSLQQSEKKEREVESKWELTKESLKKAEAKLRKEEHQHQHTKDKLCNAEAELSMSVAELERTKDSSVREELEEKISELQAQLAECELERSQLSKDLEEATNRDEEQQGKVAGLEQLLTRVEDRIAKLEEENVKLQAVEAASTTLPRRVSVASGETAVLQAQLERLESQLEKAREASVLDRQACRTAQSDLYKKEKELADARIDIRIAQRELKSSEQLVALLKQEQEELNKQSEDSIKKMATLNSQLQELTANLETSNKQLELAQTKLKSLKESSEERETELREKQRQLLTTEADLAKKSELATKLQASLDTVKREAESAKNQTRDTSSELSQLKAQVSSLQLNNEALREACTMLDEQLEDSDKVRSAYEMQIANGKQERERLQGELEKLQCDLRAKVQETEELRATKNVAEEKLAGVRRDANFQAAEALEDSKELAQQLKEARLQSDQLLAQVNELETVLCESDRLAREQKHVIEALQAKTAALQEEIATTLTDLQVARESADALATRLEMSRSAEREVEQRLSDFETCTSEEKSSTDQRIQRMQATLAQQTKLIDFLQSQALAAKKKRTLADKLFGSRPKENVAPSPSPLRPIGPMSAKEKARTWDCRPNMPPRTPGKDLSKCSQQTPVTSKQISKIVPKTAPEVKKAEAKVEFVIPISSGNAPMIMDQRVLPEYCRLTINCAVQLSEQVVLLGAEEGLYSLHPLASGFQLVQISGASKIKHIVTAPHLGLALFISGSTPEIRQCELRSLIVAAEAAQCSKPSITLKVIEHAPDQCHLCAVSDVINNRDQANTFLCVASPSHVSILRWNVGGTQFEPVRLLTTSHPASSLLFTPHSLLIVCDDVFEVDLQDFSVEEFLDISDTSLSTVRAVLKTRLSQSCVKLIDVTRSSAKSEPEFMLCLPDFAIFLDAFGHRSRPGDLKWHHRPLGFVYRAPSLFVQYAAGILELKPNADDVCKKNEESSTTDDSMLTLLVPKLLGGGVKNGTCVVSSQQGSGATALITLSALGADDISLTSEETGGEQFSFTSSLENSLDGDNIIATDAANKKVQFVK